jgi:pilus assembly protein CpaE
MATGPSDLRVLLAPSSPEYADLVTTTNLRAIFRELMRNYDCIVVDSPAYLEERVLEIVEQADTIVLVTSYNITSVKNTKVTLNLLQALGVPREKVSIVLNQNRPKVTFSREDIEETLRTRVLAQLPYDPRVDEAIDSGKVFIEAEPKSEYAKQLQVVIDYLHSNDEEHESPPRSGAQHQQRGGRRRFSLGRR